MAMSFFISVGIISLNYTSSCDMAVPKEAIRKSTFFCKHKIYKHKLWPVRVKNSTALWYNSY